MPAWRGKYFEIEELYTNLLYITQHQIGGGGGENEEDAAREERGTTLEYLKRAFNIEDERHERILEETRKMEPPEMHLNIEVVEAKDLVPKDANGKSDPFCILYLESVPTKRYNTAVKTETLAPIWQEHFQMPLNRNPDSDSLYVEVWDFDAAETVPEKMSKVKSVKGMRGLVKLAKEIAITATNGNHDNEFIGSLRIPLQDISVATTSNYSYSGGCHNSLVKWYPLEKKSGGAGGAKEGGAAKRRGLVKLRLGFSSEHSAQVAFQEHRHLLRILLLNELESAGGGGGGGGDEGATGRWNCAAPFENAPPARVVLSQHALQRGLPAALIALSKWVEFGVVHARYAPSPVVSFEIFAQLASELCRPELLGGVDSSALTDEQIRLFWESTRKILHSGLNIIRKIRLPSSSSAQTNNREHSLKQLLAIVRMVSSLSSLSVPESINLFPLKLYTWFPPEILEEDRVGITEALKFAVVRGAADWFEYIVSNNNLVESDSDEEALRSYIKIIQLIRIDLQRAMEIYEKLFIKSINFPYTKTLYVTYEKRISDLCMVVVEDICGRLKRIEIETSEDPELSLGTTLFELYLAVQRFSAVGKNLCPDEEEQEEFMVNRYYDWFKAGVAHWLEIAVYKAVKRIERAVEFDDLQPVDSSVQYSSSAVDTLTIFYQIKVFWTQLAWPDVEGAYAFIAKIVDDICKCCITYVEKMSEKAEESQLKEDSVAAAAGGGGKKQYNQFDVSKAWCYAINNIDYVRMSIEPLAKDLGLETVIEALADQKSQQDADRCKATLQLIIDNAKDTIKNKIIDMLEVVALKMAPAMSRYLMEGAELSSDRSSTNNMDKLLEYLDSNLVTLHDNLNDHNANANDGGENNYFQRILMIIWDLMANSLCQLVNSNLERRRPPSYYSNLHKTLNTLVQFFNLPPSATDNTAASTSGDDDVYDYGDRNNKQQQQQQQQHHRLNSNNVNIYRIEKLLKLYGLESSELIHQYHLERLNEQLQVDASDGQQAAVINCCPNGLLTVKAYFFNDSLNVLILNARHLKSLDNNGKCDSYIKIRLSPENEFIGIKAYKTNVQKDTQFPLYDESFSIPLTPEQRSIDNAIVIFEVKDKDFLKTRFLAESFLSFNQIQETTSHDGFSELEQIHLKLSRPTSQSSSEIVNVLSRRKGDTLASNFVARIQSKINSP